MVNIRSNAHEANQTAADTFDATQDNMVLFSWSNCSRLRLLQTPLIQEVFDIVQPQTIQALTTTTTNMT